MCNLVMESVNYNDRNKVIMWSLARHKLPRHSCTLLHCPELFATGKSLEVHAL